VRHANARKIATTANYLPYQALLSVLEVFHTGRAPDLDPVFQRADEVKESVVLNHPWIRGVAIANWSIHLRLVDFIDLVQLSEAIYKT
jgi:hypothetical protein